MEDPLNYNEKSKSLSDNCGSEMFLASMDFRMLVCTSSPSPLARGTRFGHLALPFLLFSTEPDICPKVLPQVTGVGRGLPQLFVWTMAVFTHNLWPVLPELPGPPLPTSARP